MGLDDFIDIDREARRSEMERIVSLPEDWRSPEDDLSHLVDKWTDRLGKPSGKYRLRPVQALSLDIFSDIGGLLGQIGVGFGKTLFALLAPKVRDDIGPFDTILLHPAATRGSLINEARKQRKHFDIETQISAVSYHQLSMKKNRDLLFQREPELIIADEAHNLRNPSSTRGKRLKRYMRQNPGTMFVAMSGTLTNRSLDEYSHLSEWALGSLTPIPRSYMAKDRWKNCIDVDNPHNIAERSDWRRMQPLVDEYGSGKEVMKLQVIDRKSEVRKAFNNRFHSTVGVVRTTEGSIGASLYLNKLNIDVSREVQGYMEDARNRFVLPCGQEIDDPLARARAERQLSLGFYYRWDWEAVGGVDRDWLYARREWNKQVNRILKYGRSELDSVALVENAIERGEYDHDERVVNALEKWKPHRHKDPPPTETIWVSDFLIRSVCRRVEKLESEGRPPLVWYKWDCVAERLEEAGLRVAWPGKIDPESGAGSKHCAVSIHSAREGKNLQQWDSNLVVSPPSSGYIWEQLLGRTHRQGQPTDNVKADIYAHTGPFRKSIKQARVDAQYIEETHSSPQKLLYGDWSQ